LASRGGDIALDEDHCSTGDTVSAIISPEFDQPSIIQGDCLKARRADNFPKTAFSTTS
jgi:hypothetical protein